MSTICEVMEREAARYGSQCPTHEEGVGVKDAEQGRFSIGNAVRP